MTFRTKGRSELPLELETLNQALADIVKAPHYSLLECPSSCDISHSFAFRSITTREVQLALGKLKVTTATGPDELPASLLKEVAPIIAPTIAKFFNLSFSQATFPQSWKQANISAVYKSKGSKTDPANYPPISILPVLARTFEKIAAAQLYDYCDTHDRGDSSATIWIQAKLEL